MCTQNLSVSILSICNMRITIIYDPLIIIRNEYSSFLDIGVGAIQGYNHP